MSDTKTTMLISAWFSEDKESLGQYLQASEKIFLAHGMTKATRFDTGDSIAGEFQPDVVVVLEWDNEENCKSAFNSPEYLNLLDLRDRGFSRLNINILNN